MSIILFIIGWLTGLFIASFTLVQAGIVIFFGMPTTLKLNKANLLQQPNPIQRRNFISLMVWIAIYSSVFLLLLTWFWNALMGFLFGTGIILLFSVGKLGANRNNISDYIESNQKYFSENVNSQMTIESILKKY